MITLITRQSKQPLFQNRILSVPQCQRKTNMLLLVANARNSIFTPTVYATASMIMRKIIPGLAVFTIIFSYCPPLAFAEIGPPFSPTSLFQSLLFGIHDFNFYVAIFYKSVY